jgi:excisionase family DNA binding protein
VVLREVVKVRASHRLAGSRATVHTVSTADITWLNTAETARRLGVTPRTLYRFIDEGQLPAYRFGRVIRLKESEVAEFIEACRITPGTLEMAVAEPIHDLTDGSSPKVAG